MTTNKNRLIEMGRFFYGKMRKVTRKQDKSSQQFEKG